VALALAGTLLSSMHQSFLGGLFLIMKGRIYPLWYSPYIHTMFYLTAIPSGMCMVIIAMYLCVRSLGVKLDYSILTDLAKVSVPMLIIFAVFRVVDLLTHGGYKYLFLPRMETGYFWLENFLLVIIPIFLFTRKKVLETPVYLYWTACIEVMGLITNRLNISITAMEDTTHAHYVPKWSELMLTLMVVAAAVVVFRLCVLYLDILPRGEKRQSWLTAAASA
jgi:Ni/Fe-hydrogenase subunit HybB-like protein